MIPSVRSTEEFLAEVQQALQANGPVVALRIQTHMGMTRQASATAVNNVAGDVLRLKNNAT